MQNIESYREYTRKYSKETRDWRKAHGFCIRCGREKSEPDRTHCVACAAKNREKALAYYYRKKAER